MSADVIAILMLVGLVWGALKLADRKPPPDRQGTAPSTSGGLDRTHLAQTAAFAAEVRADSAGSAGGGGAD